MKINVYSTYEYDTWIDYIYKPNFCAELAAFIFCYVHCIDVISKQLVTETLNDDVINTVLDDRGVPP